MIIFNKIERVIERPEIIGVQLRWAHFTGKQNCWLKYYTVYR